MDAPKWPWVLQEGLLPLVAVLMGLGVLGWFLVIEANKHQV